MTTTAQRIEKKNELTEFFLASPMAGKLKNGENVRAWMKPAEWCYDLVVTADYPSGLQEVRVGLKRYSGGYNNNAFFIRIHTGYGYPVDQLVTDEFAAQFRAISESFIANGF